MNLKRYNGWFPIISASLLLLFWIMFAVFLPMTKPYVIWVLDDDWIWINCIGFLGSSLGVFAVSVFYYSIDQKSNFVLIAYGLSVIGIIFLTSILFFETFILKGIALQDSSLIKIGEGFYNYPVFKTVNLFGGLIFSLGIISLGFTLIKEKTFKKWKVIIMIIGCPLFGIVMIPENLRLLGVLLYSISFISIGIELNKNKPVANST